MESLLEEHFNPAKRFHERMVGYLDEYSEYLLLVKSDGTLVSHCSIILHFIDYLHNYHSITELDQITASMANSRFYAKYKTLDEGFIHRNELKEILRGFFTFIYGKYGIKNENLMAALV
jgi:hypothetical protein